MNFIRKNWKKITFYVIIVLAAIFIYFKFFKKSNETMYITQKALRMNLQKIVNATGEIGAIDLVTVGAQASGKIEKLYVEVGQEVKKDDMIAQIDSTTQQNDVNINKAKLESYNAQLDAAKISLKVSKSKYDRLKKLIKTNAASKENLEEAQDEYELAKARVAEVESFIKQTEISLSTAFTNLSYTKITAPLDGTILSVPVKEGQTVNAAMTTPTIVQIADLSEIEVLMEISEGDITNITPGDKVTFTVLSDPATVYETKLKSIDPGPTPLTNGTYTGVVGSSEAIYYYGRLIVSNENRKLRVGMTTQNIIYVANIENALVIPAIAIKGDFTNMYVDVLKGEEVQKKQITIGLSDGTNVEVKSGVNEGDDILIISMSSSEISDKSEVNLNGRR